MSEDTAKELLADKDISVLNNILRSDAVKEVFDDDDFEYILSTNNEEVIENLISYLDDYSALSDTDNCIDEILNLNNDYLTLQIANNYNTPKKVLKKLLKHNDPDIVAAAKSSLE